MDLLDRDFFSRPAARVAPELLGCVLEHETADGLVAVRLTEVEAYEGEADPASHAYRGQTARNAVMYGPPGHAYVYFTYGMHFCVNAVCQPAGRASAVLLRAGEVVAGEPRARERRGANGRASPGTSPATGAALAATGAGRDLARGPARLCQALGIDRAQNGADLCDPASPVRMRAPASQLTHGTPEQSLVRTGPRVGVRGAADTPWRFWLAGEPTVSVYRPHVPRRR